MYTYNAARLGHAEGVTGRIGEGLRADFVVLDRDPLDGASEAKFTDCRVLQTYRDAIRDAEPAGAYVNANAGGLPTNMLIYHNWVDVAGYSGPNDGGLVTLRTTPALTNYRVGGAMVPGTYRLRVDSMDNNGTSFTNGSTGGHKAYSVRAVNGDALRTTCTTCEVAGWNEISFFTPFDAGPGGNFTMNLFSLTPDYAGLTVAIDIYDVGDIASSNGLVTINIPDPSGNNTFPGGVNIYDLGVQRSNLNTGAYTVIASAQTGNTQASFVATDTSNGTTRNGHWVHVELPIPSNYNPAPGQDWWSLQYVTGPNTTATDTVTVAIGLKGGPVHLVG